MSSPNNNAEADGMASIIAHELAESVTDPQINAWCAPGTPAPASTFVSLHLASALQLYCADLPICQSGHVEASKVLEL